MKNRVLSALAFASLLVILASSSAQAQIPTKLVVSVPFDFTVGKTTLKAGTYSIKKFNGSALLIKNGHATTAVLVSAPLAIASEGARASERLVFNRYGDNYFLTQVWLSVGSGLQIYPTKQEQKVAHEYELANDNTRRERVEIAIRTKE